MRANGPGQAALLLLDVVSILQAEGVGYAVIGAMAASAHGVVRASLDADAILSWPARELGKLETPFRAHGFQTELRRGDQDDPIAAILAVSDSHGNRVDLLAGLRGLDSGAFSRSIQVPFQGVVLRVIGREDFIAMKVFAGGPLDIDDARRTIAFAGAALDATLLRHLTGNYGSAAVVALERLLG